MSVVIAIDDPERRLFARTIVSAVGGLEVEEVADGSDLFDRPRNDVPTAVVLDHMLPTMTGLEAAARIRLRWPEVPIVVLSASLDEHVRARAAEVGRCEVMHRDDAVALPDLLRAAVGTASGGRSA